MKTFLTTAFAILLFTVTCRAQWTAGTGIITTTNKVGIGAAAPGAQLQVGTRSSTVIGDNSVVAVLGGSTAGGTAIDLTLHNNATATVGNESALTFTLASGFSATGQVSNILTNITNGASDLRFLAYSGSALFEGMRITSGGKVGIGTATPTYKLSIVNPAGQTPMGIQTGAGGAWQIGQNVGAGSNDDTFGIYSNTFGPTHGSYALVQFNSSNGNTIFNQGGGNVGIGTSSPAAPLNVQGGTTTTAITNAATTLTAKFNTANPPIVLGIGYVSSDNPMLQAFNNSTNQARSLIINPFGGNVGIGTITPDQALTVNGTVHSKSVVVDNSIFPDYVFNKTYALRPLSAVKTYIDLNHHLPEMPSAAEVAKNGQNLGEVNALLLKKVEELTLYMIERDNQMNQLQEQVKKLLKTKKQAK